MQSFDDFESDSYTQNDYIPFQFRQDKTEEGTLKWLNDNFMQAWDSSEVRRIMYRRLLNRYKNVRMEDGAGWFKTTNRDRGNSTRKPSVKVNFFYDFTEQRVSQVSRQKHSVGFIPWNGSEQSDLNNAKACKMLTENRFEQIEFEQILRDMDRKTFMYGHSFSYIYWNPEEGPYKPEVEALLSKFPDGKIPRLDEKGKIVKDNFLKQDEVKVGDVCIDILTADRVFPERYKTKLCDMDFIEHIEWVHKEKLKADYPSKADKIEESSKSQNYTYYDYESYTQYVPENMVMIRCFSHKPTKYLDKGAKIIYCDSCILEWNDFPYKHGKLPYVENKDIEVPEEFWGRPFLINLEQLSKMYDMVQSSTARNHGTTAAPKIYYPEGSIDLKKLNNEFGAVPFKGPTPPIVAQHNYVNRGEFELQDRLEEKMMRFSGLLEVSQGKVPAGITAYSAIRYLDEQEFQRASNTIAKRKERILNIYRQVIALMAQYYTPDDGRTVRILGRNNEYLIKAFKNFDFTKIYDVKLENLSSLATTRSGRIADIIDLNTANQKDPVFGKKEIVGLLDLGLNDAFKQETNYAADTARSVLEMIVEGEEQIPEPGKTDDILEWYRIFSRHVESPEYKLKTQPEIVEKLNKYIETLEYLMWVKSQENQLFAMKLQEFDKFPMFFDVKAATELQMLVQLEENPMAQMSPPPMQQTGDQIGGGFDANQMQNTKKMLDQEMKDAAKFQQGGMNA